MACLRTLSTCLRHAGFAPTASRPADRIEVRPLALREVPCRPSIAFDAGLVERTGNQHSIWQRCVASSAPCQRLQRAMSLEGTSLRSPGAR